MSEQYQEVWESVRRRQGLLEYQSQYSNFEEQENQIYSEIDEINRKYDEIKSKQRAPFSFVINQSVPECETFSSEEVEKRNKTNINLTNTEKSFESNNFGDFQDIYGLNENLLHSQSSNNVYLSNKEKENINNREAGKNNSPYI